MKKVAVFIDHLNMFNSCLNNQVKYDLEEIASFADSYGTRVIGKVYLNANMKGADPGIADRLFYKYYESGFDPVYSPEYIYDEHSKSLADSMMICDLMQILYEKPYIDTFIIASGDKDFLPVVRRLVELGKEIIIIGVGPSVAQSLINECERLHQQFVDYTELSESEEEW